MHCFDKMEVLDRKTAGTGNAESIEVRQHMEPFDEFRARYDYRLEAGALRFSAVNLDTIRLYISTFPGRGPQ